LLTPHEHAEKLVAGIAGATHRHFPRAGHMLLHQAPRELAEAITEMVLAAQAPYAAGVTA
jgi:pimeloyl-ACP methyl ester carboxylesterase